MAIHDNQYSSVLNYTLLDKSDLGLVNTTNQALNNECEQNKSLEYDVKLVKASGHSSESLQSPKQTLNFVSPFV